MFKSKYPISEHCPQCGSSDYTRRKPETRVAFSDDRVCKGCQTRYTPPTPAWAGIVFIIVGMVFVAIVAVLLLEHILLPSGSILSGFVDGCGGGWAGLIGIVSIVHGVRSLTGRKKVRDRESIPDDAHKSGPRDITDSANKEAMIADRCPSCGTIDAALSARGFCLHCQLDVGELPLAPPAKRPWWRSWG
jgi:hypothetical protein